MKLEAIHRTSLGQRLLLVMIGLPVLALTFPNIAAAQRQTSLQTNTTFEIKIEKDSLIEIINSLSVDTTEIQADELELIASKIQADALQARKDALHKYFTEVRPSKFVNSVDTLAALPHWRQVTAIAFVESTLGKRCFAENNCWGISPGGKLAKYKTLEEGMKAHNDLIARRYSEKTYQQMNCVYVQPCNPRWVKGTLQI